MFFLRHWLAASVALIFWCTAEALESAEAQFIAFSLQAVGDRQSLLGKKLELEIDLLSSPGLSVDLAGERVQLRYRMAFNQIAEGWNWRPRADAAVDDYYQYKFLPLQSLTVQRASYIAEDKIGTSQQMKVLWRYDYFLAFDNLYDFYPRVVDDEAGFTADLAVDSAQHLAIRAKVHLIEPLISESTTFWKATYSKPVDFTLKKHYLFGVLDEIFFVDRRNGKTLCRILPGGSFCREP